MTVILSNEPMRISGASSLLTGLSAYYAFETLTTDSSGNGNTLTNNAAVTQVAGKIGNCASFAQASSQSFNRLNAGLTGINFGNDFTVSCWVQLASKYAGVTKRQTILCKQKQSGGSNEQWELSYDYSSDRFKFGDLGILSLLASADNFGAVSLSTWYFLCGTFTAATKGLTISVNNGAANTATFGSSPSTVGNGDLEIGTLANLANFFWDGLIDEMGIWSRVLTAAQITGLYNGGTGVTYPFSGVP